MKDEKAGSIIEEFIGIRSKAYCVIVNPYSHELKLRKGNSEPGMKERRKLPGGSDMEECLWPVETGVMEKMSEKEIQKKLKGGDVIKKLKGIPFHIVKEISEKHYRAAVLEGKKTTHEIKKLQSKNHEIATLKQKKVGITIADNKGVVHPNQKTVFPFCHPGLKGLNRYGPVVPAAPAEPYDPCASVARKCVQCSRVFEYSGIFCKPCLNRVVLKCEKCLTRTATHGTTCLKCTDFPKPKEYTPDPRKYFFPKEDSFYREDNLKAP